MYKTETHYGPSFRAQVAAQNLAALLANPDATVPTAEGAKCYEIFARDSVRYADALIAELAKKETAE